MTNVMVKINTLTEPGVGKYDKLVVTGYHVVIWIDGVETESSDYPTMEEAYAAALKYRDDHPESNVFIL